VFDGGQAATADASPDAKLEEVGDAIDLGCNAWLKFACFFCSSHEMEQFLLNAFTRPKLDHASGMDLTEVMVQQYTGTSKS
jgi:hypothetical protein